MSEGYNNVLSVLDFLALDEHIVDERLKCVYQKKSLSSKELENILILLQYKKFILDQESKDGDFDQEEYLYNDGINFLASLLKNVNEENIYITSKIVKTMLCVNYSNRFNCEHFLQQIVASTECLLDEAIQDYEYMECKIIVHLKVCDSIINAMTCTPQPNPLIDNFLMDPIFLFRNICEKVFMNEKFVEIRTYFLINTLNSIINHDGGYKIINLIWEQIHRLSEINMASALKALCDISKHILLNEREDHKFNTDVVESKLFWESILYGLTSSDKLNYKMALYLAKISIESIKQPLVVTNSNKEVLISYDCNLSQNWEDFFVLLESLEETQSNIILPSLNLFNSLVNISCALTDTAFYIGLKHENIEVRTKCIQYRLSSITTSKKLNRSSLKWILETINDIDFFANYDDSCRLMQDIYNVIESDSELILNLYTLVPEIQWSPVPLYHIMEMLNTIICCSNKYRNFMQDWPDTKIFEATCGIIQLKCNDTIIRVYKSVVMKNILNAVCYNKYSTWKQRLRIFSLLNEILNQECPLPWNTYKWMFGDKCEGQLNEILDDIMNYKNCALCSDFMVSLGCRKNIYLVFEQRLNEIVGKLRNICNRQYVDLHESFNDFAFVANASILLSTECKINDTNCIFEYLELFVINVEELNDVETDLLCHKNNFQLFDFFEYYLKNNKSDCQNKAIIKLFKTAYLMLPSEKSTKKRVLILNIMTMVLNALASHSPSTVLNDHINLANFIDTIMNTSFEKDSSYGLLRNILYETSCQIVSTCVGVCDNDSLYHLSSEKLGEYIEFLIEHGGYSCIPYILTILTNLLPDILLSADLKMIYNRIWNDIQELKQNSLFIPAINTFIDLITNKKILRTHLAPDTVKYCEQIIEFGHVSSRTLYSLALKLSESIMSSQSPDDYELLISIIVDIMLFSSVPKKDQRITRNLFNMNTLDCMTEAIERDKRINRGRDCYDVEIQLQIRKILNCQFDYGSEINKHIMEKVYVAIKNKTRYHFNSQLHRTLIAAAKSLLLVKLKRPRVENDRTVAAWCVDLLNKMPHQNSVRVALEWRIALHFLDVDLNKQFFDSFNFWSIPVLSQLYILYFVSQKGKHTELILDELLNHTMGPNFSVRLLAQYLSCKIYEKSSGLDKYEYTIGIVKRALLQSADEKNYIKMKNNYFVNDFHVTDSLTDVFVEHFLQRSCDGYNGEFLTIDTEHLNSHDNRLIEYMRNNFDEHKYEYKSIYFCKNTPNSILSTDTEKKYDIQKKYIPWSKMTGIDAIDHNIKNTKRGELILVASLIDKLPNLGGMARTSEVFGIKTYVVANKANTEDKQFRGLSVSAEQWIDVEQVPPGDRLIEYLKCKKSEGYTLVAAEQTRNSVELNKYSFPKKSLLLLGHEKTGVPYDILPLMDACVEIPQQGVVRSLNVHVTAAIFIWEYTRQHTSVEQISSH